MSLISTYQSRKSLFAEKLITKGVEASATDGLTTLINKIDDIQSFTEGLLLYADKKIAQSEDTVNLYALLLEDNVAVSGETVRFYSDIPFTTTSITEGSIALGDDYWVSTSSTGNCWIGIGGSKGYIQFTSTTIQIYISSWSQTYYYTGKFHIKDEVLTYTDMNGETQTIDLTGVGTSYSYGATNPFTVEYFWKDAVTNSEGIATIDYDCTGSGLREFYATYGSIVSVPCSVWDCIFKDCGDNDKWWFTDTTNGSRTVTDNIIDLKYTGSSYVLAYIYNGTLPSSWADKLTTATIFHSAFAVEFDIVSISDNTNIGFRVENSSTYAQVTGNYIGWEANKHIKMEFTGSKIYYYVDGVKQSRETDYVFTDSRFSFRLNENTEFKIKEFKAYPI